MNAWQRESCNIWTSHCWVLVIWSSTSSKRCQALESAPERERAGPCPRDCYPQSFPSPSSAVPLFLEGCCAEQLLFGVPFPSQGDRDLPEPFHLFLCVSEGLLVQHFSHLLCFLWWKPSTA